MFKLFESNKAPIGSVWKSPELSYIERVLSRELARAKEYYSTRIFRVKSNHLLARIINTISSSYEYDYGLFFDITQERASALSRHFELTSPVSTGKIHNGVFFGEGNSELLLSISEDVDIEKAVKNWRDITAVKVIDSGTTAINMVPPDGIRSSSGEGFYVVSIDMALLSLQYRAFQEHNMALEIDARIGLGHFIHRYVLTNMLESLVNTTLCTRVWAKLTDVPYNTSVRDMPTPVADISRNLDKALDVLIDRLSKSKMHYQTILSHLPAIGSDNAYHALQLPDIVPTRQVWWALLLSRLRIVDMLTLINTEMNTRYNKGYIEEMYIDYKRLSNDKAMKSALPTNMLEDVNFKINRILEGRVQL